MIKYKMIITDVDGVLTDGKIVYSYNEKLGISEIKSFSVRDGSAIKSFQAHGVNVAIISGRNSGCVSHRAKELGIDEVYLGITKKIDIFNQLLEKYNLQPNDIIYVGDDVIDIECMKASGFSGCPSDACKEVIAISDFVSSLKGGQGVLAEILREVSVTDSNGEV